MVSPQRFTGAIACSISIVAAASTFAAFAAERKPLGEVTPGALPVKTSFADEHCRLSPPELDQVISLAKECGLSDVAEVQTFYIPPLMLRRIRVTSTSYTVERNTTYEFVDVNRVGWEDGVAPPKAKTVGRFWVSKPYKRPILLRAYQIANRRVQIQICEGVSPALADTVLTQMLDKKAQFNNEECRRRFAKLDLLHAGFISKSPNERGRYKLDLRGDTTVSFKVRNGRVMITGIGEYMI